MLNPKLIAATAALLTASGLAAQPACSQDARSLPIELQQLALMPVQPGDVQSSQHRAAAVELYQALNLDLDLLHRIAAEGATTPAIADFEEKVGRTLTESESQQMFNFWYGQFQELLSPQNVEAAIAGVYIKNFTLEELNSINQSENPVAQVALPAIAQEIEAAIVSISDPFLKDETWVNNTAAEMIEALPFLQEQYRQPASSI